MNTLLNMEDILKNQICGFHQYILDAPVHLNFASANLCEMLGAKEDELLHTKEDLYLRFVHPKDHKAYTDFIKRMSKTEGTDSLEYRLIKIDGTVICVKDTMTAKCSKDGMCVGTSVLTDITELKNENNDLQFLNTSIPCGFLRYTCEKQPRITYMNPKMAEILRLTNVKEAEIDYLEMYKSNLFLMIPMEERRKISEYLRRAYASDGPMAGEITLLRCDGTRAHIFGWVTKVTNAQGDEEFQSVCMDVTERYKKRKTKESHRYLKALADVYDKIFEFNLHANTVKCLHCEEGSHFKRFENVAMQMDDALENWLVSSVHPDDQLEVRRFFMDFSQRRLKAIHGKPAQMNYKAYASDGVVNSYTGMFIKIDEATSFYCCREMKETDQATALKIENDQLKEKMRDLVMQFSDGLAAFELTADGLVKPLYASENVCEFFGYTKEEWIPLTERFTPIEKFVANSEALYEDFAELLRTGEAEFTYFDYKSETKRKIKAICSEKEPNANTSRYVMLYSMDENPQASTPVSTEQPNVLIRTFGYFDVFVDGNPIAFRNKKSKELLALLVDRKGGYVTSEEAISFLWEDETVSTLTLSRYRKVALRLKSTLEEYGILDIIEAVDGKRRIVMDKVECDLYQYLSGKEEYAQLFKGSYLSNFSWGETTLGELLNEHMI